MKRPLLLLDDALNAITMYRLVLYSLVVYAVAAITFGLTGTLSFTASAMLASLGVLLVTGFLVRICLEWITDVPANFESTLITVLILFFIFKPTAEMAGLWRLAAVAVIALASKYVLAFRGKHIFNPAAIGVVIAGLVGLASSRWWIATPVMLPLVLILGLLIARKLRRFQLVLAFTGAALVTMIIVSLMHGGDIRQVLKTAFTSWPLVFLGTIMLTEPSTMPTGRNHRLIYGLGVGVLFASQLQLGPLSSTPEVALVVGNLYAYIVSPKYRLKLRLKHKHQLSKNVYDFVFEPNRSLAFRPGQYMEWTLGLPLLKTDGRGNRRTFTIASSPTESEVHLGVKFYEPASTFKTALQQLEVGDHLHAGQIGGDFVLPRNPRHKLLFVAGGIGITPFRSMLKYVIDKGEQRDIIVLYAAANKDELSYREILTEARKVGARLVPVYAVLTTSELKQQVPDLSDRRIFVSGPPRMVAAYQDLLRQLGVKRGRVMADTFSGY